MSLSTGHEPFVQRWRRRLRGPITRERVTGFLRRHWARLRQPLPIHAARMASAPLMLPDGRLVAADSSEYSLDYPTWITQRVARRCTEYEATADRSLFSIITPVFDTPGGFLKEMAASVFAQDFPFEWVICDNGSRRTETLSVLDELRRDARVKIVRLDENVGIMRGTRAAFDAATGRYVLPVDSDDLLYPDALRVMAVCLAKAGWPAVAYSDEDKVFAESVPYYPCFKPDWDPALFLNCCYIAHLCAIERRAAIEVSAYTDDDARGCHDWDTFTRLLRRGHVPLHVPEVLYSWRIHEASSASTHDRAKLYTLDCQKHVLENHLASLAAPHKFELRSNPLFGRIGLWYPARKPVEPEPLHVFVFSEGTPSQLGQCLKSVIGDTPYPRLSITVLGLLSDEHRRIVSAMSHLIADGKLRTAICPQGGVEFLRQILPTLPPDTLVAVLSDNLRLSASGWAWEAIGVLDVHHDSVAVSPRLLNADGLVASAGEHFGFSGLSGAPDCGRHAKLDSGYHSWAFCQRSVSLVPNDFFVCRQITLLDTLRSAPNTASRALLGAWLGATAARTGGRIVFTPFLQAQYTANRQTTPQPSQNEAFNFLQRHHDLIVNDGYYSRFFDLRPGRNHTIATPRDRAEVLNLLLSCLQGQLDFVGTIELNPREYSAAAISVCQGVGSLFCGGETATNITTGNLAATKKTPDPVVLTDDIEQPHCSAA